MATTSNNNILKHFGGVTKNNLKAILDCIDETITQSISSLNQPTLTQTIFFPEKEVL